MQLSLEILSQNKIKTKGPRQCLDIHKALGSILSAEKKK
jgi:hypothetical protein